MNESKICANCEHFVPNEGTAGAVGPEAGQCRRYPPTPMIMQRPKSILGDVGVGMAGVNPPVNSNHSCGEFKDRDPHTTAAHPTSQ